MILRPAMVIILLSFALQQAGCSNSDDSESAENRYAWHTFYGASNSDSGSALKLDKEGNVYVCGISDNPWNGPSGENPLHSHSGEYDAFVLKLDSNGIYQWHTFYGGDSMVSGYAIEVDEEGDVFIAGSAMEDWVGPNGEPSIDHLDSTEPVSAYLLKLDSSGAYQWHTFLRGCNTNIPFSIAVDNGSGIMVFGNSEDWAGPGGEAPLNQYNDGALFQSYVVKLSSEGFYQWHTFYGGDDSWCALSADVDDVGNIFLAGSTRDPIEGPNGEAPLHPHSGGEQADVVLLKLSTDGTYQWHTFIGGSNDDVGTAVVLGNDEGVFISGNSYGVFDGPDGEEPLNRSSSDNPEEEVFVLKMSVSGEFEWHTFYGADGNDYSSAMSIDNLGNIIVTGTSQNIWHGSNGESPECSGCQDFSHTVFALQLEQSGAYRWHSFFGGTYIDISVSDIDIDQSNNPYITGSSDLTWNSPNDQSPLNPHTDDFDAYVIKFVGVNAI